MNDNKDFDDLIKDIIINEKFGKLNGELHHGINRYIHSMNVAKKTYKVTKKLKLDYKSATRAALLHDFYSNDDLDTTSGIRALYQHPSKALDNTTKYFNINAKEANIIESHMFPIGRKFPKYKESYLVSIIDKIVGTYEIFKYKRLVPFTTSLLLVINFFKK